MIAFLSARAKAAEASLLSVREALANMIDERDEARAEVERLRAALQDANQRDAYARGEMARLQRLVAQVSHGQDAS